MFEQRTPPWILAGGFALTAIAGMVNAVGFLGAYHQAFSHLSGTATFLATDWVQGRTTHALDAAFLLVAFFGGAALSGLIIQDSHLRAGRRYGLALLVEAAILITAAALLNRQSTLGAALAASACGLQNAMATTYSGAIVRTTHITGIVTDLGLAFSHWIRRAPGRGGRTRLLLALLLGFIAGGAIGASLYARFDYDTLLVPASLCALTGVVHIVRQQRLRRDHALL